MLRIAVCSGHLYSTAVAYADGMPLTDQGETIVVRGKPLPGIGIHCIPKHDDPAERFKEMGSRLRDILAQLRASLSSNLRPDGFLREDRLVLAVPGVSAECDFAIGKECVKAAGWPIVDNFGNVQIIDDTIAGLFAASWSTKGICAFAGAGASVYVGTAQGMPRSSTHSFKPWKLDGFGPMLGDHGSGFHLAVLTLRTMFRRFDEFMLKKRSNDASPQDSPAGGGGDASPQDGPASEGPSDWEKLRRALHDHIRYEQQTNDEIDLQTWFEDRVANEPLRWRTDIVSLAIPIMKEARRGNGLARRLVRRVARSFVDTICMALGQRVFHDMKDSATIYCQGRMFWHSKTYFRVVKRLLQRELPYNPVKIAPFKPIVGALLVARSSDWTIPDNVQQAEVREAILAIARDDPRFELLRPLNLYER